MDYVNLQSIWVLIIYTMESNFSLHNLIAKSISLTKHLINQIQTVSNNYLYFYTEDV